MFEDEIAELGLSEEQLAVIIAAKQKDEAGLKNKAEELIGKNKELKSGAQGSASELERLRLVEEQFNIQEQESQKNYEEASRIRDERHKTELEKALQKAEKYQGLFSTKVIDDELRSKINEASITNPAFKEVVFKYLRDGISLNDEGVGMAGEKTISELVSEYAASEEGQNFVTVTPSSGGGQKPSSKRVDGFENKKFSEMGSTEKTALYRESPEAYQQLKEADGQ